MNPSANNPATILMSRPLARVADTRNVVLFGEVLFDAFPDRQVLGGAPLNVACHLRAFGLNPILISRIGNDEYRNQVLTAMAEFGMETIGIQSDPAHPTGQVKVHFGEDAHRFEILPEQAYDFIHPAITRMIALSAQPDLVYFGTLAQRARTSRRALHALLESTHAPRMLDINLRKPWYDLHVLRRSLSQANFVKVSVEELAELDRLLKLQGDGVRKTAAALLARHEFECLLVTLGRDGAWLFTRDGTELAVEGIDPGNAIRDTVGAGDAFTAVFMLGTLSGWSLQQTLVRANRFAAAICTIPGAIPSDHAFYLPYLAEWQNFAPDNVASRG